MTLLPVVERELRVAARRNSTYRTRFIAAVATVALSVWIWGWLTDGVAPHERGQILFRAIAGLAFAYSILIGIGASSDSLSEEKREGTLGLLFLTDLKGYDVVLGKLAATSLNAFYSLLAIFPVLAVPLLLGAVTFEEFLRMTLTLANTLFFSLAAGMAASAVSVRDRHAMAGAFLLIFLVATGPPLIGLIIALNDRTTPYDLNWLLSSAVYPAVLATEGLYGAHAAAFWRATAVTHSLACFFLLFASVVVRRMWREAPGTGRTAQWLNLWRAVRFGQGPDRAAFRERLLGINPVLWLAGRDRFRQAWVFALLFGLGLAWVWVFWKWPAEALDPTFHLFTAYSAHLILKLWVAGAAASLLAEERRRGTLESLLTTPLTVPDILEGEALALKRQFFWPVTCVLFADLAMLNAGAMDPLSGSDSWLFCWLGMMLVFVADLYTLGWVGLWLGLTCKRGSQAVVGTIGRVLVLPWTVLVLALTLFASNPSFSTMGDWGLLTLIFTVALINDMVFFAWARLNLLSRFRLAATQRFDVRRRVPQPPPTGETRASVLSESPTLNH